MPAFLSSNSISFCDYFNNPLPNDVFEEFPRRLTHLSTNIEKFVSSETVLVSTGVLSPDDIACAERSLESFPSVKEPILQTQAFETEQDVSDAFHSHVLAKVVPALSECLKTIYNDETSKVIDLCKKHDYRIYQVPEARIKSNEDNTDTQQRHSDYVVFFAPIKKICDTKALAKPPVVAVSMKNFGKRLIKASKTGDGAIWPIVALFVVEAKAAGIVDGTCWDGTAPPDDAIGINNVDNIVPQLRLYSNDTCCQYVFLTDYLRTVLFRVKDNGLEKPGGTSKQHQVRNRVFGRHGVIHVENTYQDRGTRALLFATGLKVLRKTLQLTAEK